MASATALAASLVVAISTVLLVQMVAALAGAAANIVPCITCKDDRLDADAVVGIDLGTTMSLVAHWGYANGRDSPVLKNTFGRPLTPSFVSVKETGEFLVGSLAYDNYELNPDTTFRSIKRILGRRFSHPDIAAQKKSTFYNIVDCNDHWAAALTAADLDALFPESKDDVGHERLEVDLHSFQWRRYDHAACLSFPYRGGKLVLPVEFVSALVLADLRMTAQRNLHRRITQAVVTVPAYFTEKQKAATRDAARIAGIEVLRLLPEPTAAAYFYEEQLKGDIARTGNVLVFDLGGGTFDISILAFQQGRLKVRAIEGDNHCGGDDVDDILRVYVESKLPSPLESRSDKVRLQKEIERKKQELSLRKSATIHCSYCTPPISFNLTRADLDVKCIPFFARLLPVVKRALDSVGLQPRDINVVLLVGGSSKLRKVHVIMEEFMQRPNGFYSISEDESVAIGAAALAHRLANRVDGPQSGIQTDLDDDGGGLIRDAIPHSLGVVVHRPKDLNDHTSERVPENSVLIPKMSLLPTARSGVYHTLDDYQTAIKLVISEGDYREAVEKNDVLGEFVIEGLRPLLHGEAKVNLTFAMDTSGLLVVTAQEINGMAALNKSLKNLNWSRLDAIGELALMRHLLHRILRTAYSFSELEAEFYH